MYLSDIELKKLDEWKEKGIDEREYKAALHLIRSGFSSALISNATKLTTTQANQLRKELRYKET